jgi:quercetin dioxygenase-like cupin family protein
MRKMVVVDPEKIEWEAVKELPEGAWIKVLSIDEETGAFSALFKFDKEFHEPRHIHPSDHDIVILAGKLVDAEGNEVKKGMFFFAPAGEEHGPFDAPEECVFYAYFNGPAF